jgi:hypothetical protein
MNEMIKNALQLVEHKQGGLRYGKIFNELPYILLKMLFLENQDSFEQIEIPFEKNPDCDNAKFVIFNRYKLAYYKHNSLIYMSISVKSGRLRKRIASRDKKNRGRRTIIFSACIEDDLSDFFIEQFLYFLVLNISDEKI